MRSISNLLYASLSLISLVATASEPASVREDDTFDLNVPDAAVISPEAASADENAGFAGKFGHGLGHGTGLAIHEAPRLSPIRETILEPGMLVTVEPGIYLPEWGGIRIENQVVVRENGADVLNSLPTAYAVEDL